MSTSLGYIFGLQSTFCRLLSVNLDLLSHFLLFLTAIYICIYTALYTWLCYTLCPDEVSTVGLVILAQVKSLQSAQARQLHALWHLHSSMVVWW